MTINLPLQAGGSSASGSRVLNTTDSDDRKDISYAQYKETPMDARGLEEPVNSSQGRKRGRKRMTWKEKVVSFADTAWNLFMSVNFIFSIVIMMVRL